MIRKLVYILHRFLGAILCLFLIMWLITGLVLIYHSFPNITDKDRYTHKETLNSNLPPIENIIKKLPKDEKIKKLSVRQFQDQSLFQIETKSNKYIFTSDSLDIVKPITPETITNVVRAWNRAPVAKIDTLYQQDIWIMYSKYEKELPIYKFYFDDEQKTQLYISSKSAEVQQKTTMSERFWSWMGSIPHRLYIVPLRKHTQLWINTITTFGVLLLIMSVAGMYLGIDAYRRKYKQAKILKTPYKKKWYKWHHIWGIIFGILIITWSLSGIMSLQKVPQWMVKTHQEYKLSKSIKGKSVSIDKYILDYRLLSDKYKDLKEIEWSYFQGIPIYKTIIGDCQVLFDASSSYPKELWIGSNKVEEAIVNTHGKEVSFQIELINKYDNYYLPWKKELALPVYRIDVADADNSLYYINPKTGEYKYLNNNKKARKWLFNGLHYFQIEWLTQKPLLWYITIWVTVVGSIIVCSTGIVLSLKFARRKIKRKKQ